jgi:hypothetical protein
MQVICTVDKDTDAGRYLIACARIRDVTVTHLMREVIDVVTKDQLITAVLDDDSRRRHHDEDNRYLHRFREVT